MVYIKPSNRMLPCDIGWLTALSRWPPAAFAMLVVAAGWCVLLLPCVTAINRTARGLLLRWST